MVSRFVLSTWNAELMDCIVGHSADLKLWFDHPPPEDAQLKQLSRHMSSYLMSVLFHLGDRYFRLTKHRVDSNFVANLNPNGPGRQSSISYLRRAVTDRFFDKQCIIGRNMARTDEFFAWLDTISLSDMTMIGSRRCGS